MAFFRKMQYTNSFRITIPKQICDDLEVQHGDVFRVKKKDNSIVLTLEEHQPAKKGSTSAASDIPVKECAST